MNLVISSSVEIYSRVVNLGFLISLLGPSFILLENSIVVGNGTMDDDKFKIYLNDHVPHNFILHGKTGSKHCMNEKYSTLWLQRLGLISIEIIKRFLNYRVLETVGFTDFDSCVDCIKGKETTR